MANPPWPRFWGRTPGDFVIHGGKRGRHGASPAPPPASSSSSHPLCAIPRHGPGGMRGAGGGLSLEKSRQASNPPCWHGAGGLCSSRGLVSLRRMRVRGQGSRWPQLPGWGQGRCRPCRGTLGLGKLPRGFSLASSPRVGIYPEPFLLHPPLQIKAPARFAVWCQPFSLGSSYPLWIFPLGDEVPEPSSPVLGRIRLLSHLLPAGAAPALPLPCHSPCWGQGRQTFRGCN